MSSQAATASIQSAPGATQTASPNGGAAAPQAQAPAAPWYGDLSSDPDLKGYAELKAFKTPGDALKSYRDAEKLIGVPKDQLLRLPKPDAQQPEREAAMNELYNRLGRPATPADYKIPAIEGDEDSAKFTEMMKPILHGIGLSQDQAVKLKTAWDGYIQNAVKDQETAQAQKEQVELQNLHREWPGDVFTQRQEMARRAVRDFVKPMVKEPGEVENLLGKIEDAIGTAQFLKLFSNIGEKTSEARFVDGSQRNSTFGMTPDAAHARIQELKGDKEYGKRWLANPRGPEGQEMDRLMVIASQRQRA